MGEPDRLTVAVRAPAHRTAPDAVVVGLCPHGLAVVRALARQGIAVLGVEANAALPGCSTRYADVVIRAPVNGPGVAEMLLALAAEQGWSEKPVLFLTNDNMVRQTALHAARLREHYVWSWQSCPDEVLTLLSKENIPAACEGKALNVPRTARLAQQDAADEVARGLRFPIVAKPTWPLGDFKIRVLDTPDGLRALAERFPRSLPFVVQEWIEGGVQSLKFCVLYLDRGRVVARMEGRKAYAGPDGLGQATVMEPWPDDRVYAAAVEFVRGTNLSGPVAVEFKQGPDGSLWVIEPNVGRTEYCVDVVIRNGVNLPYLEYCHVRGMPLPETAQTGDRMWFDTDRDPLSWLRYAVANPFDSRTLRPLLPFAGHRDFSPWARSLTQCVASRVQRAVQRARRTFGGRLPAVRGAGES